MAAPGIPIEADTIYSLIRRQLEPHVAGLLSCRSSAELRARPAYRDVEIAVEAMLGTLDAGDFVPSEIDPKPSYRIVAWNIERGTRLDGQIQAFNSDPYLKGADTVLLVEADIGMARSGNVNVARTLARELGFRYVFAPCYFSLVKGSGVEYDVEGENLLGLHGNAVLSRYPIRRAQAIPLPNGVDKMCGREKRLGRQAAVAAEIAFPGDVVTCVSVHLDAQSSQAHRRSQMRRILDRVPASGRVVLGGDWNTSTYDSSHAFCAIVGFWRRVFMGVDHVIPNHYLRPENWFERGLFRLLESRGYDYRSCNLPGERTTYYDIADPRASLSLGEWVPRWCFPFIRWALGKYDGKCPFKLDWFATRGVRASDPRVLHDYRNLSDHDPIGIDIEVP